MTYWTLTESDIDRIAIGSGLQIPAGAEEFLARGSDDRHAQALVIAEIAEHLAHQAAGLEVDGVRLGAIERHLEDGAFAAGLDRIGHFALLISASTAMAVSGVQINGFTSTSSTEPAFAIT